MTLHITFSEAAMGTTVEVPTLEGTANLKVPPGIQSGHILRMRAKGFPALNSRARGDQLVHVQVVAPTKMDERQQAVYEELRKIETSIENATRFGKYEG